jgi:hypothetical protein
MCLVHDATLKLLGTTQADTEGTPTAASTESNTSPCSRTRVATMRPSRTLLGEGPAPTIDIQGAIALIGRCGCRALRAGGDWYFFAAPRGTADMLGALVTHIPTRTRMSGNSAKQAWLRGNRGVLSTAGGA